MGIAETLRQARLAVIAAALAAGVAVSCAPAQAEPAEAFATALNAWAAGQRIGHAFVVVRRPDRPVYAFGIGGADPEAPVLLASLSKAITAACVATLIRDGRLGFDTPLSAALAKFTAAYGRPRDPRLERVTVAELLTHRAGFATGEDDDPASGRNFDRYVRTHTSRAPAEPSLLAAALRERLARAPGTAYTYGNAAYLVLGAVVEEASGLPYATYCGEAVLEPLGITAALDPVWQVTGPMGGWRMRAADYLRILDLFAADDTRLGPAATAWRRDPRGKAVAFDRAAWYGLGTFARKADGGVDVWHWGSWDYTPDKGERGTVRTSLVNYAARLADGTAWFVHAEPRAEEGAPRNDLVRRMFDAYRSDRSGLAIAAGRARQPHDPGRGAPKAQAWPNGSFSRP